MFNVKNKRILIVEDDPDIRRILRRNLELSGWQIEVAGDGAQAFQMLPKWQPDLIILDLNLPAIPDNEWGIDGFPWCEKLRQLTNPQFAELPIIMLTAYAHKYDQGDGFELGADDYITKPIDTRILHHRMVSILKRASPATGRRKSVEVLTRIGKLVLVEHSNSAEFEHAGVEISLQTMQFNLLWLLASNPGHIFTFNDIIKHLWNHSDIVAADYSALREQVARLRRLLGQVHPKPKDLIKTYHGRGYCLIETN